MQSQVFSKSIVSKELFKYLVDESLKGEAPKEYQVAQEIFGKRGDSEKDKNIRIYIHNLRKKLVQYYENEGKQDAVKFELPKGGYKVVFKINRLAILKSKALKLSPLLFALSIFLLVISILIYNGKGQPKLAKYFIWKDIYQSEHPTLIVLGDHYFFRVKNVFDDFSITRVPNINSDQDLEKLINENPGFEEDIEKTTLTYINKQAPFGLYKIMSFLGGGKVEIDFQYSSNLRWEDVENKNVVFIGSYKTQNILKTVHKEIGIDYHINESKLFYQVGDSIFEYDARTQETFVMEYASLSRFITDDGRIVTSFMCNSDVGNMAVIKYLTNPENLKGVNEFDGLNFKAVFEVQGQENTDFKISLKRMDIINESIEEVWPE